MKTLAQVEPRTPVGPATTPGDATGVYRITQPGSYYLTGHVTGVAGRHGIFISAPDVTLDLNGYSVVGVAGSLSGVRVAQSGVDRITVRNGTVRGWGVDGVSLGAVNYASVEGVHAFMNGDTGVWLGSNGRIQASSARNNQGVGMRVGPNSLIADSRVAASGSHGVVIDGGTILRDSSVSDSAGTGVRVQVTLGVLASAVIERCAVSNSGQSGISAHHDSLVQACAVSASGQYGIVAGTNSVIRDCVVGDSSLVPGFDGAGIFSASEGVRIERNTVFNAPHGVQIFQGLSNFVASNTVRGAASPYSISPGNTYGQVLTISGMFSSNNPYANFVQ